MKKFVGIASVALLLSLIPTRVMAHCPLCVGGAGAAAALASFLGVSYGAIAVFMGGFAVALSLLVINRLPQKFKFQNIIVGWAVYLTTLLPLYPFLKGDIIPWIVSMGGEYGGILNRTYLIDLFVIGSVIGSLIVLYSMKLSGFITEKRDGRTIKFQGLLLTFALLIITAVGMQLWPR